MNIQPAAFSIIIVMLLNRTVLSQRNGVFPFVTINDSEVAFDNFTSKFYTTTILLSHLDNDTLQISDVQQLLTAFYNGSTSFEGFTQVNQVNIQEITTTTTQVSYNVVYNFANLLRSVAGDRVILNSIGRLSYLRDEMSVGSDRSIVDGNFSFVGESLCAKVGCAQGEFMICSETKEGVVTFCTSTCKRSYCTNNGLCHHYNGNEPPQCSCPNTSNSWYVGRRCELVFHMWMFILFIVVVVLLVAVIIVTACIYTKRLDSKNFQEIVEKRKLKKNKNSLSVFTLSKVKVNKALTVENASTQRNTPDRYVNAPTTPFQRDELQRNSSLPMDQETSRLETASSFTSDRSTIPASRDTTSYYNTTNYDTADTLNQTPDVDLSSVSTSSDYDDQIIDSDTLQRQFQQVAAARSNDDLNRRFPRDSTDMQTVDV